LKRIYVETTLISPRSASFSQSRPSQRMGFSCPDLHRICEHSGLETASSMSVSVQRFNFCFSPIPRTRCFRIRKGISTGLPSALHPSSAADL